MRAILATIAGDGVGVGLARVNSVPKDRPRRWCNCAIIEDLGEHVARRAGREARSREEVVAERREWNEWCAFGAARVETRSAPNNWFIRSERVNELDINKGYLRGWGGRPCSRWLVEETSTRQSQQSTGDADSAAEDLFSFSDSFWPPMSDKQKGIYTQSKGV